MSESYLVWLVFSKETTIGNRFTLPYIAIQLFQKLRTCFRCFYKTWDAAEWKISNLHYCWGKCKEKKKKRERKIRLSLVVLLIPVGFCSEHNLYVMFLAYVIYIYQNFISLSENSSCIASSECCAVWRHGPHRCSSYWEWAASWSEFGSSNYCGKSLLSCYSRSAISGINKCSCYNYLFGYI